MARRSSTMLCLKDALPRVKGKSTVYGFQYDALRLIRSQSSMSSIPKIITTSSGSGYSLSRNLRSGTRLRYLEQGSIRELPKNGKGGELFSNEISVFINSGILRKTSS